ncbi:glycosyltransferase involved in cell wall biosynthesis [Desulfohalotomaculum tongense]|uniref:TPR domain-containing glycosyltransferase n=1 Tax=Desulforadius tongensis TaxID=1216062 RepID=UPI001958FA37|nr:TPR domain-containing glycosyltransferase [Desulforadius tongensis]MBM7854289.1 glycosyltransferase involved in cell wall biosynthesis [Desulforadius tongensis]
MSANYTVSLCMIVKNEAENLARCLSSVENLVDEIIVVDTGSTDGTPEIARRFKARVFNFRWVNDFSAARNYSLEQATGDWIIYLDADEELMVDDREHFYSLLSRSGVEGYYFNIINSTSDQPGGQLLRHSNLRLFRNNPAYRFQGAVHEQIIPSILASKPSAKLLSAGIQIFHHGYRPNAIKEKNKTGRNLDILQKQVAENPQDNFLRYNLAVALFERDDLEASLAEFQKVLESLDLKAGYAPTVYRNYAICLLRNNQPRQALDIAEEGIQHFPAYTDLYYLKGQSLEKTTQLTRAQDAYLKCLELGEAPAAYVSTAGVGSYLPLRKLGQLMEKCGQYRLAVSYYQKAYQACPGQQDTLIELGSALKKVLKDPLQVRAYIQKHIKVNSSVQLIRLADLLYSVADYQGCLIYLNEFIARGEVKTDQVTVLKAKCLVQLGRWEEAKAQFLEIAPGSPLFKEAVLESCVCSWAVTPAKNAAWLIERIKDVDYPLYKVLRTFNQKVVYDDDERPAGDLDAAALEMLLVKLLKSNNISLARSAAALLGEQSEGEICCRLGRALFNGGHPMEAFEYLLQALEKGISHPDMYYMLGCICYERQVLWEAEQFLHQAVKLEPHRLQYYEKLVQISLQQSCETLLRALACFPDNRALKEAFNKVKECQLEFDSARGEH